MPLDSEHTAQSYATAIVLVLSAASKKERAVFMPAVEGCICGLHRVCHLAAAHEASFG